MKSKLKKFIRELPTILKLTKKLNKLEKEKENWEVEKSIMEMLIKKQSKEREE